MDYWDLLYWAIGILYSVIVFFWGFCNGSSAESMSHEMKQERLVDRIKELENTCTNSIPSRVLRMLAWDFKEGWSYVGQDDTVIRIKKDCTYRDYTKSYGLTTDRCMHEDNIPYLR
jgi:hypothetical protein